MKVKWKGITAAITAAAMLTVLGACASEKNATNSETPVSTTREYKHMAGTSVIPVKPERVVTDWYYGQLVALGLKPIGTDDFVLKNHPYIQQTGTVSLGQSMEKIIELEPDLIISWGANKYEQFSKIAPTVPLEINEGPIETVRIFGDILGRKQEAENWIQSFEASTAAARDRLAGKIKPDQTFTILTVFKKTLRVYGFVNMGGYPLYEALKLKAPAKVEEILRGSKDWYKEISFEVLPEYAGTDIILTVYDPDSEGGTTLKQLQESSIWNGLDAVKNNRVHIVKFNDLYNDDPVAVEQQVKMLTELILK
jgi:iron complex transport system substrate-binding protein